MIEKNKNGMVVACIFSRAILKWTLFLREHVYGIIDGLFPTEFLWTVT